MSPQRIQRQRKSWADQRADLIENIEHLLGYDTAAHIAARLGYEKPRSLARRLSRAGRHDLARQFWRVAMNTTPTATAPNKYRNDLAAGACYGQLDFTEQPLAAQYAACLNCPVRDLCPEPTPWPKRECCRRGHVWGEKYASGACKACQRTTRRKVTR